MNTYTITNKCRLAAVCKPARTEKQRVLRPLTVFYKLVAFLCLCLFPALSHGQSSSQNYILTRTYLNAPVGSAESGNSYIDVISYHDGLGRPYQTLEKAVKANLAAGSKLATLQEYDAFGRELNAWLPVVASADYMAPATLKSAAPGNYSGDSRPYSSLVYEASPLNRAIRQYGPGSAWYSGHPVKTEYLANSASVAELSCINYSVNASGALANNGNYGSGQLSIVRTTDEDGNISCVFTDKQKRTLLERRMKGTETNDTYYVYDVYDNLRLVLQPMYQSIANLDQYAFQYKHDGFKRCIWKKFPGAQYMEYVYDNADRLIFSQDGNQRANSKWTYYQYDNLDRLTLQGECVNKVTTSNVTVHIRNFYDKYADFRTTIGNNSNYPDDPSGNSKGNLTGSIISVLGGSTSIRRGYYYDVKARVTKTVENNLLSGFDITSTVYSFTNKPATVTHTHTASGKTTRTEVYTYTYDHANRVSKAEHTLNGTKVTLADYTYDNLGRLSGKSLHGSATNKSTYAYNIRSWLTGITGTKFNQNLYYTDGNNATKCYNGNISSMTWKAGDEATIRGYKLTYDGLSRLAAATYGETAAISTNLDRFTEKVTKYDKNGNIQALQRYGQTTASAYGLIDNLTYTLTGNQLNRVDDAVTASAYNNGFEFKNGASAAGEYAYDANGNLTKDLNKGITGIQYNVLNLPSLVTFNDGSTITYTYSADGTKLRTVHKIGTTNTTMDYCSNVIYENGTAKQLLTEEGYVSLSDNKYHYYLKDHQGNNRVVINTAGTVEETSHYYPFGGVYAGTGNVQPYKYNGKEYDSKKGLNWYDYRARQYDAAVGRFTTLDPLSDKYYGNSLYAYCLNNPVRFIDPTGKLVSPIYNEKGNLLGTDDEGLKGKAIIMNESNFKQGMSHEKALSHNLGYNGLISDEARSNYVSSYTSLKDRPDYDGYLTISEANKWYREGNGQPLFTSLERIDLSGIYSLGEKYIGQIKSLNLLLHSGSLNDGLVYGNITLKRYPNHSVRAFSDKYDFEMHNSRNPFNWGRNAETIIGRKVAGEGQSYEINIYGNKQLVPLLPWIK